MCRIVGCARRAHADQNVDEDDSISSAKLAERGRPIARRGNPARLIHA
jgi:hypothetical protein